uniref:Sushi domain-containing protein n=1 Tax=Naja naja TaxID=35670 RepID=A0A8C7E2B2_NAJNA
MREFSFSHIIYGLFSLEITCNSPRIPNGTFRPQRTIYHDGDLIRIQCDSGFTFEPDNGEKVVECTKNGWSPPPKCISNAGKCRAHTEIENAEIIEDTTKKYLNGEKINYQCNDGFDIYGSAAVTCTQNKWSRLPRCVDVRCSSPPEIENGEIASVIKAKYLPQEKVHYRCNTSYTLLGTPFITCLKNHWTETPRCAGIITDLHHVELKLELEMNLLLLHWLFHVTLKKFCHIEKAFSIFYC